VFSLRAVLLLLGALLLAGCVTVPPRPAAPAGWESRRLELQAVSRFSLDGRIAAAVGQEGFSASLAWQQRGSRSDLTLRAPLGFGSAEVTRDGADIRLRSSRGQKLSGTLATDELARRLGFEPPLDSLRYWVLGVPEPARPAVETLGQGKSEGQGLAALEQDGWRVDYAEYKAFGAAALEALLPRRLTLTRPGIRLRLVIDHWTLRAP
jgi:outer membrane lipoprotein LolB